MSTDQAFRRALAANPNDTDTRLVYADWLDDRDDPRGAFLRLEVQLAGMAPDDPCRAGIEERLRELHTSISPEWLAALDRTRIENCTLRFAYQCPKKWEYLLVMREETVRFCDTCKKNVFHCHTTKQARELARQGKCIAVDSRLVRTEGDIAETSGAGELAKGMLAFDLPDLPFQVGNDVRVRSGMFAGMEASVIQFNDRRRSAEVLLRIFGRPVPVEIALSELELLS